jgi:hypothetical protein
MDKKKPTIKHRSTMNTEKQEALKQQSIREMKVFFELYGVDKGLHRYIAALGLIEHERTRGYPMDWLLSATDATQEDWDDLQQVKDDAAILLSVEHPTTDQ